ncbi:hypothetical protein P0D69_40985 [Paraburkholderia sediminicola]|uniref:hypothetical protein n=1 Tax=Paraburkholderia sediminicola TaxID=458836 RepID=UPI0038B92094
MDQRSLILCFSAALLAITSGVYGLKFLKKRNYLLAIEWLVVAFSSSNALNFFATGSPFSYGISHFLDAFSRGPGMPIITVVGLMAVTQGYKPSLRLDIVLLGGAVVGTIVLVSADFMTKILPYFYVVMWAVLSIYLAYFVRKLLGAGQIFHSVTVTLALVSSQTIACIYDFYQIPGDEHNVVFNFYVLALVTWSYLNVSIYYAYCALERALERPALSANRRRRLVQG